ncbi:MAG TPA: endo alpha-1,4 polygalactosaminidase, partial [Chloroflexota bacterium]
MPVGYTVGNGSFKLSLTLPQTSLGPHTLQAGIGTDNASSVITVTASSPVATSTPLPAATSTPLPAATSTPTANTSTLWAPALVTPWQWEIDHPIDVTNPKDMGLTDPNGNLLNFPTPVVYDIDGFDNGQDPNCNVVTSAGACAQGQNNAVQQLHAMGFKVVCYIDTGVYETYRPDAYKFPTSVIGNADSGWNGSYWLDIRQTSVLFPIEAARIKMCKDKGFDSIEPDEMVDYSNSSGFPLSYQDQLTYNRGIAQIAHSYGISIALKDDPEQAA